MRLDGSSEVKMPFEMFSRLHMLLRDVSSLLPAEQRVLAEGPVIDMDRIYSKMDMSPLIMKGDPGKVIVQADDGPLWAD